MTPSLTERRVRCLTCALTCAFACALASRSLHAQSTRNDSLSTNRRGHSKGATQSASNDRTKSDSAKSRATLARIVVKGEHTRGYATQSTSSATRTDTPLRDAPQAVAVVGRSLINDQAMRGMADVVRYVPGVSIGLGEGHRDAPTIRGNASTADFFVDGVRDDAQYLRDLYNVERVEALKGSNALAFGRGGGGGVINRVTKQAEFAPVNSLGLEGGSYGRQRAMLDVGDTFGRHVAVRLNGMIEGADSYRTDVTSARSGINPTATLIGKSTTVRIGYEHFHDRRTVDRGIPSFRGAPSPASVSTFFGDPADSRSRMDVDAGEISVEQALPLGITLRHQSRLATYDKFYQNIFPGAVDSTGVSVALSGYNHAIDRTNRLHQTDATWSGRTGWLGHTVLAGTEFGRQVTAQFRNTAYFNGSATSQVVPFSNPRIDANVAWRQSTSDADNKTVADVAALFLQDQLALGGRWRALAGIRWDRFAIGNENHRTGEHLSRTDRMVSPRAGLVFRAAQPLSLYGSYSVTALPASGDQFGSLTATTSTLRPERFFNREVGAKWDPANRVSVTAAAYRLDRTNTSAPSPNDPSLLVQTGHQRTTGVEIGASGDVTSRWQVAGAFAAQRATIVSRTSAAKLGASVPLVPNRSWSLWNRLQPAQRIGFGVGIIHQARVFASIDNTVTLPAFTRFDAATYLTLTSHLRAQVNIENLLNERYFPTAQGNNNILPGSPRSLRVSLTTTR